MSKYIRLNITSEGQTEHRFVKDVLYRHDEGLCFNKSERKKIGGKATNTMMGDLKSYFIHREKRLNNLSAKTKLKAEGRAMWRR